MAKNELNRCECGSQVAVWQDDDGYYVVGCGNWGCPNCAHRSMDIYKSEESAIKAWNRRVKDDKNKMAEVAKLFGKKLDEEFIVNDEYRKKMICKITERGLFFYHSSYEAWWQDSGLLSELITGEAVIVDD